MVSLTIVTFLVIGVSFVAGVGRAGRKDKSALRASFDRKAVEFKIYQVLSKLETTRNKIIRVNEYIKLQARFEEKLDFCLSMKAKTTKELTNWSVTATEDYNNIIMETTDISTKILATTTEDYVKTDDVQTKGPVSISVDYFETTKVPTRSTLTTEADIEPTKKPVVTTEDNIETEEVSTKIPIISSEKSIKTTEEYFEPTEKSVSATEEYFESKEKSVMTTEEYFEPTEKSVMTTGEYFQPTEMPVVITDYPEITETSMKILSTIIDYPEDVTNYRTKPPTEIPMETTTTTMEPWIDTTSSIRTKPWWITSTVGYKLTEFDKDTTSMSPRHTTKHLKTTTTKRLKKPSKRTKPTKWKKWTIKKFTVKTRTRGRKNRRFNL